MQTVVAQAIREGQEGPDIFDEERVLIELEELMKQRGHDEMEVEHQISSLRFFSSQVFDPWSKDIADKKAEDGSKDDVWALGDDGEDKGLPPWEDIESFLQGVEEALPGLPEPETQEDKVEKEDDRKAVACLAEPVVEEEEKPLPLRARLPPDATGYVVSISARI